MYSFWPLSVTFSIYTISYVSEFIFYLFFFLVYGFTLIFGVYRKEIVLFFIVFGVLVIGLFSWVWSFFEGPEPFSTVFVATSPWFSILGYNFFFTFILNFWVLCFILMLVSIFLVIFFYTYSFYLKTELNLFSFLILYFFFLIFMLLLVISDSFLLFYLAWEGIGLMSFFLIGFWFSRLDAIIAAMKAIIYNKVGDFFLLFSFIFLLFFFNISSFSQLNFFTYSSAYPACLYNFLLFSLILASSIKSAQFGLHGWLLSAMEGPTPVSALLHSATMVTAGVILLMKVQFLFILFPYWRLFLFFIGFCTAFYMGFAALASVDFKKIIAFSTAGQLGFMFMACSLNLYHLTFFHLFCHAFFKALLFLIIGLLIHGSLNWQSSTQLSSGFFWSAPWTALCFLFSIFSLSAFPFFSGFYTKDVIFEIFLTWPFFLNYFIMFLFFFLVSFSFAYSFDLIKLVFDPFLGNSKFCVREPNCLLWLFFLILASCGFLFGFFFNTFFSFALFSTESFLSSAEFYGFRFQVYALFLGFLSVFSFSNFKSIRFSHYLFSSQVFEDIDDCFLDFIFFNLVSFPQSGFLSYFSFLEKGFFEFFGFTGLSRVFSSFSIILTTSVHTGQITTYLRLIFVFMFVFLICLSGFCGSFFI